MRRQTPIAHALYNYLFPSPTPQDPPSFAAHLAKNLVPEVRIEVDTFYGGLNSVEARYPGLNYCFPPHRMRLGRFRHHRRLFEAFDALGLTYQEIQDFCCWEGSRWARLKYEEDQKEKVRDTTGDEIGPWVDRRCESGPEEDRRPSIIRKTDISVMFEDAASTSAVVPPPFHGQESGNTSQPSGPLFDERLAEIWMRGGSVPPELEAILKEGVERGDLQYANLMLLAQAHARTSAVAAQTGAAPRAHNGLA